MKASLEKKWKQKTNTTFINSLNKLRSLLIKQLALYLVKQRTKKERKKQPVLAAHHQNKGEKHSKRFHKVGKELKTLVNVGKCNTTLSGMVPHG